MSLHEIDRVYVRNVAGEETIQISFKYPAVREKCSRTRCFNFKRPKSEELEKALQRILGNVSKEVNKNLKKKKKSKTQDDASNAGEIVIGVELLDEAKRPIDGVITNDTAWVNGHLLSVGDSIYKIDVNVPVVTALSLPSAVLSGYFVLPKMTLEFANKSDCLLSWQIYKPTDTDKRKLSVNENWFKVAEGSQFVPSKEHIGNFLRVSVLPKDGGRIGEEVHAISKNVICEGPVCPFEKRHEHTREPVGGNAFRVVSYNILADLYADSDFSRDVLYPYCPPQYLHMDYRKHLIIKEILGYNADIVCLQEVDKRVFSHDLVPTMGHHGFEGLLKLKTGEVAEGCATFYRTSKFRLIESYDKALVEVLTEKTNEMSKLYHKLPTQLRNKFTERSTILQVSLLEDVESERHLLVATTHLFFHPEAANIRLLQIHVCVHHLQAILKLLRATKCIEPSLVLCGDLNSSMTSGVHEYLLGKSVLSTHSDWLSGGKDEVVPGLEISHDLQFANSSGFHLYTNYVKGFNACLDYIYTAGLSCRYVLPMPSHRDVEAHVALPNRFFPSDHIAIGCDLQWLEENRE